MKKYVLVAFNNLESWLCRTLLMMFVTLLFAQILARQLFGYSFSWSEELSIYMFVWFVFLEQAMQQKYQPIIGLLFNINLCLNGCRLSLKSCRTVFG